MSLNSKVVKNILYVLVLWSIYDPKWCVSTGVVPNTKSAPCKNEHNQTEYCDSTCAKCVEALDACFRQKTIDIFAPDVLRRIIFLQDMDRE